MTLDAQLDDQVCFGLDVDVDLDLDAATVWLSAAPTASLLLDAEGTIEWANHAAELLLTEHLTPTASSGIPDVAAHHQLVGRSFNEVLGAAAAAGRCLDDQRVGLGARRSLVHVVDTRSPAASITPEQQRRFRSALLELSELSHEISGDAAFYALLARRAVEVIPSVTACRVLVQRRDGRDASADRQQTGGYDVIASSDCADAMASFEAATHHPDGALGDTAEQVTTLSSPVVTLSSPVTTLSSPVVIDRDQVALIELDGPALADTTPTENTDALGAHTIEMATLLSRLVSDLIRRRRLEADLRSERESFKHLAHHDPLTGLANRRQMEQAIAEAAADAAEGGDPIGLLFLDLDDFKSINDTFGHDTGDRVLVAVADTLRLATRSGDLCGRWGGDEFVILAPDAVSRLELRRLAERILAELGRPLRLASGASDHGAPDLDVTTSLSIGAVWSRTARETSGLLRRADDALQRAKRSGKNTVRMDAA